MNERKRISAPPHKPKLAMWRALSMFVALPAVALMSFMVFASRAMEEEQPRTPFVPYEYLNIRHRRFPWGDGTRGFFHNPKKNWTQFG